MGSIFPRQVFKKLFKYRLNPILMATSCGCEVDWLGCLPPHRNRLALKPLGSNFDCLSFSLFFLNSSKLQVVLSNPEEVRCSKTPQFEQKFALAKLWLPHSEQNIAPFDTIVNWNFKIIWPWVWPGFDLGFRLLPSPFVVALWLFCLRCRLFLFVLRVFFYLCCAVFFICVVAFLFVLCVFYLRCGFFICVDPCGPPYTRLMFRVLALCQSNLNVENMKVLFEEIKIWWMPLLHVLKLGMISGNINIKKFQTNLISDKNLTDY